MKENGTLQVLYDGKVVGKLALMAGRKIAFEYSEEWLETGFSMEKGTVGGGTAGRSGKKLVRGSNRKDEKYGGRTIGKILIEVEV